MVESIAAVVAAAGAPALVCLFYAEGLVLGKVLQPPLAFVGYVAATEPGGLAVAGLATACAIAATLGQWTLYRGVREDAPELLGLRRTLPYLEPLPERVQRRVGQDRLAMVERYVDVSGGYALVGSNAPPVVRGIATIPAGLGRYPRTRFVVASTIGNLASVALLVAAGSGVSRLARTLVG